VPRIDSTAQVAPTARLADEVEIGPFCVVGPEVELRAGVRLVSHVTVAGATIIGARTVVHPFASLGSPPQSTRYRGGRTRLVIGADCQIREGVTMNTGTEDGSFTTEVGERGFFMANSHVGHDCRVGHDVVLANGACLGGHCILGDHVFLGGQSAVRQFCTIGSHAMVAGVAGIRADVIPFGYAEGIHLKALNIVGMKRGNFSRASIHAVRGAYRMLFFGEGTFASRVDAVEARWGHDVAVSAVVAFVRQERQRPLLHPAGGAQD
jgi:UDP-N-acetylglucosamine acyltransferase